MTATDQIFWFANNRSYGNICVNILACGLYGHMLDTCCSISVVQMHNNNSHIKHVNEYLKV